MCGIEKCRLAADLSSALGLTLPGCYVTKDCKPHPQGYEPTTALEVMFFHVVIPPSPACGGRKELERMTCPSSAHLLSLENCFDFVFEIKNLV